MPATRLRPPTARNAGVEHLWGNRFGCRQARVDFALYATVDPDEGAARVNELVDAGWPPSNSQLPAPGAIRLVAEAFGRSDQGIVVIGHVMIVVTPPDAALRVDQTKSS